MVNSSEFNSTKFWLRLAAGLLAIATLNLVILRTLALFKPEVLTQENLRIHMLRLIFPLSLSIFFGYIAWKESLPFSKKS